MHLSEYQEDQFRQWFTDNIETISELSGVFHHSAPGARLIRLIFLQDRRIQELEKSLRDITGE